MPKKYLILVEGVADLIFLKDYLIFLDFNLELKTKIKEQELTLESKGKKIHIIVIGGCTKELIEKRKTTIQQHNDENITVLMIQDADNPLKSYGGILARMEYLQKIKKDLSIEFEIFLFPNHQDDGDLEKLLLQIVKNDKFNPSNQCYSTFVQCLNAISPDVAKALAQNKNILFNYFRAYYGIDSAKEINRVYESDYWDFESEALSALREFVQNNIIKD